MDRLFWAGSGQVSGAAAGCERSYPTRCSPAQPQRWTQCIHIQRPGDRHAVWRCAQHSQYLVQLQGRGRGPAGRRRRHDRHLGGRFGGYGFYVLKGKPVFTWNLVDLKRVRWEGTEALAPGKHTLEFDFKYNGLGLGTIAFNNMSGIGQGGTGVLKVDGNAVATQTMEHTLPLILQWDENFDIGSDTGTPVDDQDYQVPVHVYRKTGQAHADNRPATVHARGHRKAEGGSAQQQRQRINTGSQSRGNYLLVTFSSRRRLRSRPSSVSLDATGRVCP